MVILLLLQYNKDELNNEILGLKEKDHNFIPNENTHHFSLFELLNKNKNSVKNIKLNFRRINHWD